MSDPSFERSRREEYYALYFNPGTPYGTYMSHVSFLHLLHEYNKKKYFKLSPILLLVVLYI